MIQIDIIFILSYIIGLHTYRDRYRYGSTLVIASFCTMLAPYYTVVYRTVTLLNYMIYDCRILEALSLKPSCNTHDAMGLEGLHSTLKHVLIIFS